MATIRISNPLYIEAVRQGEDERKRKRKQERGPRNAHEGDPRKTSHRNLRRQFRIWKFYMINAKRIRKRRRVNDETATSKRRKRAHSEEDQFIL